MIRKDKQRKKNTELSCLKRDMVTLQVSIMGTKYMIINHTEEKEGKRKGRMKKRSVKTDRRWKLGEKSDSTC